MYRKSSIAVALVLVAATWAVAGEPSDNEFPEFEIGFSERLRLTSWDNAIDLSDDTNTSSTFTRNRTSLWATWRPCRASELFVKLTNEFRYYFEPEDRDFTIDEVFFDQLYLKLIDPLDLPLTITLGRQNIMLGEGFVVWDGHPLDGSRSAYFNAARIDWEIVPDQMVTLFGIHQPEVDDNLPIINDRNRQLVEQPESAIGAYYSGKWGEIDGQIYYIYKETDESELRPHDSDIHTLGSRAVVPVTKDLSFTAEGALQTGWRDDDNRLAGGGYAYVSYLTGWSAGLPQKLTLGGIYLSGDDPSTRDEEGWEPVFARWPKWSESYIYTLIGENGVASWSNLGSVYLRADFDLTESLHLNLDYHRLLAPERPDEALSFPGGDGHTRGDLLIGKLSFVIDEHTTGHVLWEGFFPGSYYHDDADPYSWIRFELMYRF